MTATTDKQQQYIQSLLNTRKAHAMGALESYLWGLITIPEDSKQASSLINWLKTSYTLLDLTEIANPPAFLGEQIAAAYAKLNALTNEEFESEADIVAFLQAPAEAPAEYVYTDEYMALCNAPVTAEAVSADAVIAHARQSLDAYISNYEVESISFEVLPRQIRAIIQLDDDEEGLPSKDGWFIGQRGYMLVVADKVPTPADIKADDERRARFEARKEASRKEREIARKSDPYALIK